MAVLTADSQSTKTATATAGAGPELMAAASRDREIAKHGELGQTEGKDKDGSVAHGKRKQCSVSSCSKKSGWQCKVRESLRVTGETAFPNIKVT